jgi:hypothetical protein
MLEPPSLPKVTSASRVPGAFGEFNRAVSLGHPVSGLLSLLAEDASRVKPGPTSRCVSNAARSCAADGRPAVGVAVDDEV